MARAQIAATGGSPPEQAPLLALELSELSELEREPTQVVLPANRRAPTAARKLLAFCFDQALDARVLSDAQLIVSELVSNCLRHGALDDQDSIVVRMQLHAEELRLEVHNRGVAGTVAPNGGDQVPGRGFGLDIVRLIGTRWGVRRGQDTCVWVDVSRA